MTFYEFIIFNLWPRTKQELWVNLRSQAGRAVAQIGLGLVFFMAKIMLRSGKKFNKCW